MAAFRHIPEPLPLIFPILYISIIFSHPQQYISSGNKRKSACPLFSSSEWALCQILHGAKYLHKFSIVNSKPVPQNKRSGSNYLCVRTALIEQASAVCIQSFLGFFLMCTALLRIWIVHLFFLRVVYLYQKIAAGLFN